MVAASRTSVAGSHEIYAHNAPSPIANSHDPNDAFTHSSGALASNSSQTVDFTVPYIRGPGDRPSIGFGSLDILVTCATGIQDALGQQLGALNVYMRLGNNTQLGGLGAASFYSHETVSLTLLAGANGLPDTTDTDYFDDGVVAHEFHHFVENTISHSQSRGGAHCGAPLEPNFSWSEGQSTGFGNLLLGTSWYIDTTGTSGGLLFEMDIENVMGFIPDPPGIGGELTVAELIWDLGDGGTGPADMDGDVAAVPLSELYGAFTDYNRCTDAPYIADFIDRLVNDYPSLSEADASTLMVSPENQGISYPPTGSDVWPGTIGFGESRTGSVDAVSIGDECTKSPCRGLESTAWYQLTVPTARSVTIRLRVTAAGTSNSDIDLYLSLNQAVNTVLASSTNPGTNDESITRDLEAGTYMIRVEANCGGVGNDGMYELTVDG